MEDKNYQKETSGDIENLKKQVKSKTESIGEQKIEIKEELSEEIIKAIEGVPTGSVGLVVLKGPNIGEVFLINKDDFNIGRELNSDIFLEDITVSRKHAKIEKINNAFKITDQGSLNGIYINGKLLDEKILENGDRIQIGKYIFYFFI
jgi:pSer/pThr/pTyr-binding forkhead associated (FHA) protein